MSRPVTIHGGTPQEICYLIYDGGFGGGGVGSGEKLCNLLCDDICCANTLGSLGDQEFPGLFAWLIDIVAIGRRIWFVVMGNIVDTVLFQEVGCDDPRRIFNHFINPFTVTEGFRTLFIREHCETFTFVGLHVAWNTDKEICVGEGLLRLF